MPKRKPTSEAYGELQQAYAFYNRRLFQSRLPHCLITFQRKKHTYGYFSGDRWKSGRAVSDEIALNPDHFADGAVDVLSTLVHEMVHLDQHHNGKPGRGRYHNREWVGMMLEIGLHPSSTGEPGGKKTGDCVSHYILKDEKFDVVTKELVAGGFSLSWMDRYSLPSRPKGKGKDPEPPKKPTTRQKFSCKKCGLNAWAKYEAPLMCGKCKMRMKPVGLV